jgi:hypothetical protein
MDRARRFRRNRVGLWGPAKMPPELLAKIQADVSKALDLPETRQFFKANSSNASISHRWILAN